MRRIRRLPGFPKEAAPYRNPAGCHKVRRPGQLRVPAAGGPSATSRSRRHEGTIASRGGTACAGAAGKSPGPGAQAQAAARVQVPRSRRAAGTGPRGASTASAAGSPRVDAKRASVTFELSKSFLIPGGSEFRYAPAENRARAFPECLGTRSVYAAMAYKTYPRNMFFVPEPRSPGAGVQAARRYGPGSARMRRPCPGTSLAESSRETRVLPSGGAGGIGRGRHERVRFGIGKTWVRAGRDAADLAERRVRRDRPGA